MNTDGWKRATLASLVDDVIGGLWGNPPDTAKQGETDVLVVRGADFRNWDIRRALDAAPRRVPVKSLERRQLSRGDLVLEVSGGSPAQPVGRVLVIDEETVAQSPQPLICSNFCRKVRLKPEVNPHFVKRQLDWLYRSGHTDRFQTSTTNIRNLQVDDFLAGTSVVLPDETTQARLAALLDRLDATRASGSAHVMAARGAIARFRQAILASACSGRLTADWRERNSTSEAADRLPGILESRQQQWHNIMGKTIPSRSKYKKPLMASTHELDLPPTWTIASLSQLAHLTVGNAFKSKDFSDHGIRLLRGQNSAPGKLKWLDVRHWPLEKIDSFTHLMVQKGDLILGMDRPIISSGLKLARARPEDVPSLLVQRVLRIRAVEAEMTDFIELCLRDGRFESYLSHDGMTGTDLPHITGTGVAEFPIPLPSIEEQREIVRSANALLNFASKLESRIETALLRLDRSSQAILAKAFRGDVGMV